MKNIKPTIARIRSIFILIVILLCVPILVAFKWYVYPSSYSEGNGSGKSKVNAFKGLQNINWSAINPGDTVLVLADKGFFTPYPKEYLRPTKSGTRELPIVIKNEVGSNPVIDTSLILLEAKVKYLIVEGLTVQRAPFAALIIRDGASRIVIKDCTFQKSAQGISISQLPGDSNVVENCIIYDNETNGIGINHSCTENKSTEIRNCLISKNGHHGIELDCNRYLISSNTLIGNGRKISGTSAIHVYGGGYQGSAEDGYGHYNVIRYNFCKDEYEPGQGGVGTDGNGIQLDQYTGNNHVYYNICMNNDNCGIILYDSYQNEIYNNTLLSNVKDSLKNKFPPLADLVISSTTALYNQNKYSFGNIVKNNLVVSYQTRNNVHAVYLDDKSRMGKNIFANNEYWNIYPSNIIWRYTNIYGKNQTQWNSYTGGYDFVASPGTLPVKPTGPDDAKITTTSPAYSLGIDVGLTKDFFGNPVSGNPSIGAHHPTATTSLAILNKIQFDAYPNPANNKITLSNNHSGNEKYDLILKNMNGNQVFSKSIEFTTTYGFDLPDCTPGIYLLILQNEFGRLVKKIVVTK